MKHLIALGMTAALALGLAAPAFAAEKKKMEPAAATPAPVEKKNEMKPVEAPPAKKTGALPYKGVVDTVDVAGKKFTTKNKDGKVNTFTVTAATVVTKEDAPAKFEDIKVGDYVRGSRIKKGEGEWEAVKVTIGVKKAEVPKTKNPQ